MRNLLFLFSFLLLQPINLFSQDFDLFVSLKTNYGLMDVEDTKDIRYIESGAVSSSGGGQLSPVYHFNIERRNRGEVGIEFSQELMVTFWDHLFVRTGLEGKLIRFDREEWIALSERSIFTKEEIPTQWYTSGYEPFLLLNGNLILGYNTFGKSTPISRKNEIYSYSIPLSIGYTTKSKNLMVSAGVWYSKNLYSKFEKASEYDFDPQELFTQSSIGICFDLDCKLIRNILLSASYSFTPYSIHKETERNFMFVDYGYRLYPPSNHHLFSFGISYLVNLNREKINRD